MRATTVVALLAVLAAAMVLVTVPADESDAEGDEHVEYEIVTGSGEPYAEVTNGFNASGDVVIPSTKTIDGKEYPVKAIGDKAFNGNTGMNSIELPEGLTTIGENAFYRTKITSVTLPEGLTTIGKGAFASCVSLKSVNIPSTVTELGAEAFRSSWISSAILPEGLTTIGEGAFMTCPYLESVSVPSTVTEMGARAFTFCDKLTSIELADGLKVLGESAFSGAAKVSDIEIPSSITVIPKEAFASCQSMTSITIKGEVTSIGDSAFNGCIKLKSISLPNSVTSIGSSAFYQCIALESISLPDGVTDIGEMTFQTCIELKTVDLPSGLKTVGKQAFSGCQKLETVEFPSALQTIGEQAFSGCDALNSVDLSKADYQKGTSSVAQNAFDQKFVTIEGNAAVSSDPDKNAEELFGSVWKRGSDADGNPVYNQIVPIDFPTTVPGLVYNGAEQTGVQAGEGYSLSDNTATNAGSYTATATLSDGYIWTDGTTAPKDIDWKIAKATLTVKADDKSVVFGEDCPPLTATATWLVNEKIENISGGTLTVTTDYKPESPYQEKYDIVPSGYTSDNYDIKYVNGMLTVEKIKIDVPTATTNLVYNGTEQTGVQAGEGYTLTENTATNAGSYTATATLSGGYVWTDGTGDDKQISWTIAKATLTVTADSMSITFKDPVPEFTATLKGFVNGEEKDVLGGTLHFATDYKPESPYQEKYAIIPSGYTSDNYDIDYKNGTLTVEKIKVDIPKAEELVYNGTEQTGVQAGDGYVLTDDTKAKDAGEYAATATLSDGYAWTDGSTESAKISWTIAKVPLTVTAGDASITFKDPVPELTAKVDGFVNGESESNLVGTLTVTTDYKPESPYQEEYAIIPSGYTSDNYEIKYVNGTLTVEKIKTDIPKAATGLVYNGTEQTGVTEGNGYTLTGNTATNAGSYTATATLSEGYVWTDGTGDDEQISWTIAKAPLTAITNDGTVTFGAPVPDVGVTFNGFVANEDANVLGGTVAYETEYDGKVYKESFPITASGYTSGNYDIAYVPGTLTVTQAVIGVPEAVTGLVYNGSAQSGIPDSPGYTVTGGTETDADKYTAAVTLVPGYIWDDGTSSEKSVYWEILRKDVTVKADDVTKTSGDDDPALTATVTGTVGSDTVSYTLTRAAGEDEGDYVITAAGKATQGNYDVVYVSGTFTIEEKDSELDTTKLAFVVVFIIAALGVLAFIRFRQ